MQACDLNQASRESELEPRVEWRLTRPDTDAVKTAQDPSYICLTRAPLALALPDCYSLFSYLETLSVAGKGQTKSPWESVYIPKMGARSPREVLH